MTLPRTGATVPMFRTLISIELLTLQLTVDDAGKTRGK